jgi:lipopolysaccharide transport system permease protein
MNNINITIIDKKGKFFRDYFLDIFSSKFLIYELVKKDFKIAYSQTILGPIFFILVPVIQSLVFTFFTNSFNIKEINGLPTFLFFLLGTTLWNFISNSTIKCSQVLLSNRKLISKVYFNRIIFFIVSILISFIHFIINFMTLVIFLLFYKFYFNLDIINFNINIFILPFVILLSAIFSFSIGIIFASASIKYRDLSYGLPFIFQILMFLSPVLYPMESLNSRIYSVAIFNPMTSLLELFRYIFINNYNFSLEVLSLNVLQIFILFVIGLHFFRYIDKKISDLI